ncbi:MAG: hypothetical protein ACP5RI_02775 [Candidatus Micrarchaeia archaeon]
MADSGVSLTPIDRLMDLLSSKKKLELNTIAASLNVAPNIVESWIKMLEDNNIVTVTYELGKMYVELKNKTNESSKVSTTKLEIKQADLENKIINKKLDIEEYITKYGKLNEAIKASESRFQQEFPDIEKQLNVINKVYDSINEQYKYIENLKNNLEVLYNSNNKKIDELRSKLASIDSNTLIDANNKVLKMRSIISDANKIEGELETISKSKDNAINFIRKSINEQLAILKKDISKIEDNINSEIRIYHEQLEDNLDSIKQEEREVEDVNKKFLEFRKESSTLNKKLDEIKKQFDNSYVKIVDYIASHNASLKTNIDELSNKLKVIKEEFGDISKLYDKIEESKRRSINFKEELYAIKNDYNNLYKEFKENLSKNINEREINIAKFNIKIEDINRRLEELNKKYADILE